MALSLEEVRRVAQLARLFLRPEEEAQSQGELSKVLNSMEVLQSLDTSHILPTSHMNVSESVTREDSVNARPEVVEKALSNAPSRVGTSFSVPKIIE
jgi:aspartyl-tRNA(Asn)/glutamyl-tRNA(Gln) amidotransferase subunit C